jgi:DNA-binding PadR family transcriptional regulator
MSLRHALLGLLHDHPASGYDMLRIFKLSLGNTWPATQSQIYTELTRLADAGLLDVSAQGPRGRKEYTLNEAGRLELRRWLLETQPERHPRSEALLRVFLIGALTRQEATAYLTWLGESAAAEVGSLTTLEASIDWDEDDLSVYGRLVMEYGKRLWAMTAEWAEWAVAEVEADRREPLERPGVSRRAVRPEQSELPDSPDSSELPEL